MQGMQEIPKEHLHTFQLLIHATKTTNLWSQQRSLLGSIYRAITIPHVTFGLRMSHRCSVKVLLCEACE